ncbi:hypothetical protein [Hydrogenimonas sp.]
MLLSKTLEDAMLMRIAVLLFAFALTIVAAVQQAKYDAARQPRHTPQPFIATK